MPIALGATRYTVYFYNPESNVDNFASLKTKLDVYLKETGPYQFQPFSDRGTFETTIRDKHDCILIISSWYYKELRDSFPVKPVLIGTVDGKPIQKKILSSKMHINDITLLKNAVIASAGSEEYTRKYLKSMVSEGYAGVIDSCQILAVPKDIDALISMGFGLVQAALTTEYSISKLSAINPGLYRKLTILAKSGESLQPVVAVPETHSPEVTKLLEIIEGMGKTSDGRSCLQMFGIDGWQKPEKSEWELLRK